jgi:hypothetical protein
MTTEVSDVIVKAAYKETIKNKRFEVGDMRQVNDEYVASHVQTCRDSPLIVRPVAHVYFLITRNSGYFSLRTSILAYFLFGTL